MDRKNNTEELKVIGYYIIEVADVPKYLSGIGKKMLSVSVCLGEIHPTLACIWVDGWRKGEWEAYQKRLRLSDKQYVEYTELVRGLFDSRKMDADGRFLHLSDALHFYKKFCQEIPCRLVSISTAPKYFAILSEELKDGFGYSMINGEADHHAAIGCDILGWDTGGFHSFLCNSLQRELPEASFNELGLLQNDLREVEGFSDQIQGKGEPVVWIPCRVGEVDTKERVCAL